MFVIKLPGLDLFSQSTAGIKQRRKFVKYCLSNEKDKWRQSITWRRFIFLIYIPFRKAAKMTIF